MLEDALIVGDASAVKTLFETAAVLVTGDGSTEMRGAEAIATAMTGDWKSSRSYIASRRRVLQSGDLALTVGNGVQVIRRAPDRTWRFALSVMILDEPS
jgi:hypothetical protein